MTDEKRFYGYMAIFGYFIVGIFVAFDIALFFSGLKVLSMILFVFQFPSKQKKEVWEDVAIFVRKYNYSK